ncbi:hypothetical protein AAHN97_06315 [Chitinophaga niabensis]|uniref:hypothetical protein n=1 Tax=Chitinophaga niabensis TaxID=536979 RepID=UPI0031BABB42
MHPDYKQLLQKFPNGVIPQYPIYNYNNNPSLKPVFDHVFEFRNDHLQYKRQLLSWPPSYLYFVDNPTKNAFATTRAYNKAIAIFHGLVEKMHAFFQSQETLINDDAFNDVRAVLKRTGEPAFLAFLENLLSFAYFHEYGHLVQGPRPQNPNDTEDSTGTIKESDVPMTHAREIDADWLATNYVA